MMFILTLTLQGGTGLKVDMPTSVSFTCSRSCSVEKIHDPLCACYTVIFLTQKGRVTTATCLQRSISGPATDDKILEGSVCGDHQTNGFLFPPSLISRTFLVEPATS